MRRVEGPSARRLVLVPGVALALLATGCAAQGERDDSGASRETTVFANGVVGADDPGGEPVAGGEISFVTFGEARSLDPAQTLANGTSGGIELAALYDVLLRFDPATGDYEPWLAESMQPDAEMRTWTMTLRDGVRFSDGSVLDAAAVRSSIERYVADGGDQASVWTRNVRRVRLEDERTVVFELAEPWEGFEYLLATGPGMIVGSASDRGDEFVPVGAGPFVLERMAPQEELVLTANPDYWRGAPALDTVRFSTIAGDPPKVDMLAQGQADMAYLRKPAAVTDARDRGLHGLMEINSVGEALLLNHRPGAGTADVRVRKAISLAIDRDLVNERVHEGLGIPEAGVFSELSQWSTEDQADGFDPDRARELLDEARADGFDGTISFLGVAPGSESVGIALKALLEDVGFDVELDYVSSPTDLVEQIYVSRDYEMAIWGFGIPDGEPYAELFESFHSESASNVGAYADPAMDRAVERLRTATADDQVQAAIDEVQEVWDETVPAIPLMANPEFVAWQPTIHGVGIGALPNVDLARGAGLAVDDGILVDVRLRTADPDVMAIGDVAAHQHPRLGRRVRVEHWQNARSQGRHAARVLTGEEVAYGELPAFFSDQYDAGLEFFGHVDRTPTEVDLEIVADGFVAHWRQDGRLVAAAHVNQWDRSEDLAAAVGDAL